MNAIPLLKLWTAVGVLLLTLGAGAQETQESCEESCMASAKADGKSCGSTVVGDACTVQKAEACYKMKKCSNFGSAREARQECKQAYDKWSDAAVDGAQACDAFAGDKDCSSKVKACSDKISGVIDAPKEGEEGGLLMLGQMVLKGLAANMGNGATAAANAAHPDAMCVDQYDTKARAEAEKEFNREKRQLEADIKKQNDEIAKLLRKQREKQNEIEKEIARIEKENKEETLRKETKIREQVAALSKSTVDIGKRLRAFNLAITQENQKLAKVKFNYQTNLLDMTSEKVTRRCQQQILALKNGILNSGTIDPKDPTSGQFKALAEQFRNQGAKGAGDLRALLIQTKNACFENENSKKKQQTLSFTQEQANINDRISEIQNEIADEKKRLALDQENIKKIQEESETQKTAQEQAKLTELSNLNKEMMDFQTSTQEDLAIAEAEIQRVTKDLQGLTLKKFLDAKPAYNDAMKAINKAEKERRSALVACNCEDDIVVKKLKESQSSSKVKLNKADQLCSTLTTAETANASSSAIKKKIKTDQ